MSTYPAPGPGTVRCPALPRTGAPPPPPPEGPLTPQPLLRLRLALKLVRPCWNKFKWDSLVRMDLRDLSNFQVNHFEHTG